MNPRSAYRPNPRIVRPGVETARVSNLLRCGLAALGWTLATATPVAAVIIESTRTFAVNQPLNDLVDPPTLFQETISDSSIVSITEVRVGLHLVGVHPGEGWAGDIYVALNRNLTSTAVLLNGVGVTASSPAGFGYDGWNVTFRDGAAAGDVHLIQPQTTILTGEVQPDGRLVSTDATRPADLSVFQGGAGNGVWRLSVGDLSAGGQMQLVSWSLTLTGESAVPEPASCTVAVGLALAGLAGWRFRQRRAR